MKIVAVSQRVDHFPDRNEARDALDQSLAAFVVICGHVPVPVPNALGGAIRDWLTLVRPAAVVLSGGNDIGRQEPGKPQQNTVSAAGMVATRNN